MLTKATTLKDYTLQSLDGGIGRVKEFYFEDRHWTIRYLVADTGKRFRGKQVLISPHALGSVMSKEKSIAVDLTKQQIEDSPSLDKDKPVSQQFEAAYCGDYGYPMYWGGPSIWGDVPHIMHPHEEGKNLAPDEKKWDAHLRSTNAVSGYHIEALDGSIGHIDNFIVDSEMWSIRYLLVDTVNWWPGRKVLISPQWIECVSWNNSKVSINLSRETVKQSPEYTEDALLTRDYETMLHEHYNRQGYLDEKPDAMTH